MEESKVHPLEIEKTVLERDLIEKSVKLKKSMAEIKQYVEKIESASEQKSWSISSASIITVSRLMTFYLNDLNVVRDLEKKIRDIEEIEAKNG
jgi:hypothetical protein